MKPIGLIFKVSCIVFFLAFSSPTLSYEVRTHEALTAEAIKNSIYDTDIITTLYLKAGQLLSNPILINCFRETDGCSFLGRGLYNTYVGLILK
jgi:hypothetical protein